MSRELATQSDKELTAEITEGWLEPSQLEVLRRTLARQSGNQRPPSDPELQLYLTTCKRLGLDPFARQANLIQFTSKDPYDAYATWEGLIAIAERTGEFEGLIGPHWSADGERWVEAWLDKDNPPAAAKVGVYRKGFREPLWAVATWREFARYRWDKDKRAHVPMAMWKSMPARMLGKSAVRLALKTAFPYIMPGAEDIEEPIEGQVVAESRPMNREQQKALYAMANKLGLYDEQRHELSHGRSWADLTVREASRIADELVAMYEGSEFHERLDQLAAENEGADPFEGLGSGAQSIEEQEVFAQKARQEQARKSAEGKEAAFGEVGSDSTEAEPDDPGEDDGSAAHASGDNPSPGASRQTTDLDQLPADLRARMLYFFNNDEGLALKVLANFCKVKKVAVHEMRTEHYEQLAASLKRS